ncbi:MAG: hypothetical protein P8105_06815 [Dehalococcoidia bacterium]
MMGIEWYRDLIICIAGGITCILCLIAAGVIIYFAVIAKSLNKKVKSVMNAVEETTTIAKGVVSDIREDVSEVKEEIMSPLVQVMAIVQGVRKGFELVNALLRKDSGGENA